MGVMDYVRMHQQHASASTCSFFAALCCATIFSTGTFFASVTLLGNVLVKEISYIQHLEIRDVRGHLSFQSVERPSSRFRIHFLVPSINQAWLLHSSRLFYCIHR